MPIQSDENLPQIKENPRSMIRKLTLTYLLLIPNQSADRKKTEIIFFLFLKITSYFHFFILPLQRQKTAVIKVTEVGCAVNAI